MRSDRDYLYTGVYSPIKAFCPKAGSCYVFGTSVEDRSNHVNSLISSSVNVTFVKISGINDYSFEAEIGGRTYKYTLRSQSDLECFLELLSQSDIYVDVTGLPNVLWANVMKAALLAGKNVRVLYVEPERYEIAAFQSEGVIHDLSERIQGLSPLPGFAFFSRKSDEEACFVPLLGFEGARFRYLLESVQPATEKIYPVVGVPGFRPEYPFVAYWGNRQPLEDTGTWKSVRYATANSVADVYFLLEEIHNRHPNDILRVAPIGTKPHAIGAVLYAIKNPEFTELVYDHPVRTAKRTKGTARLLEYLVSELYSSGLQVP